MPTLQLQGLMGHVNAKDSEIYTRLAIRKLRQAVDRANPLAKMKTPLLESLRALARRRPRPVFPAVIGAYKVIPGAIRSLRSDADGGVWGSRKHVKKAGYLLPAHITASSSTKAQ